MFDITDLLVLLEEFLRSNMQMSDVRFKRSMGDALMCLGRYFKNQSGLRYEVTCLSYGDKVFKGKIHKLFNVVATPTPG